jgi:hypothetical protein
MGHGDIPVSIEAFAL